jgi:hypothetical protein
MLAEVLVIAELNLIRFEVARNIIGVPNNQLLLCSDKLSPTPCFR